MQNQGIIVAGGGNNLTMQTWPWRLCQLLSLSDLTGPQAAICWPNSPRIWTFSNSL